MAKHILRFQVAADFQGRDLLVHLDIVYNTSINLFILNLIIMLKPKYTYIFNFTGRFIFIVLRCGTLHFYSGFSINAVKGVDILIWFLWLSLASQTQAKNDLYLFTNPPQGGT